MDVKLVKGLLFEVVLNEIFYLFYRDVILEVMLLYLCKVVFLWKGIELFDGVFLFVC